MRRTVAPTWANKGVEAWYRLRLQRLVFKMSNELMAEMRRAWRQGEHSLGPQLVGDAKSNTSVLLRRALSKWGGLWIKRLDKLSAQIANTFATRAFDTTQRSMKTAFRNAGFTVKFKPTQGSVEAYRATVGWNVGLIKSIPQEYLADVESAVWSSVMQGRDLATLTRTIEEKYGVAHRRAALIARDQNNKATALIENERRKELGITHAVWLHSHAGKVPRPTHVAFHNKLFKLSDGMFDKDEGKNVLPGELINCRCNSRSVIEGFE